jgi:CubicO group peptidase (beta-lactamase class C family)
MKMNLISKIFMGSLLFAFALPLFASAEGESAPIIAASKKDLPRGKETPMMRQGLVAYIADAKAKKEDIHSIMIVQHGKIIASQWLGEGAEDKPHIMHSVSKTFTSMAVGFAIAEGKLHLDDKVISFFPDKLPAEVSDNLKKLEIRHLLTMNSGHDTDPTQAVRNGKEDWVKAFLATPITHEPGTYFVYNSVGTYVLSAIVQKVTGQKVFDYLQTRLFEPLGIDGIHWEESPQGINCGGWGLYLKTEDMAKMGQFILQKGKWNGKQLIPASWIEQMTTKHVESCPAGIRPEEVAARGMTKENSDWVQGYCYQMWRCRNDAVRADGANGQYIIVLPKKNAVIVTTAKVGNMQEEINLLYQYFLPLL